MSVCLCMIVRDEAEVIARALRSAVGLIDRWCIVDTGSTDGTQDIIRRELAGVPGELLERPWRNFAANRNEALDLAAAAGAPTDYLLILDADDMIVERSPRGWLAGLDLDAYMLRVEYAGIVYERIQLVRAGAGYRYVGAVHEVLVAPLGARSKLLEGLTYRCLGGSARRRDPRRFHRDAELLERELAANPGCTRTAFYLAQSWRDAGEPEKALTAYLARAEMGGWVEEVYLALLNAGRLAAQLGRPEQDIAWPWMRAWRLVPARAEAPCELARHHRAARVWQLGYAFARAAVDIASPPAGTLFAEADVYAWRARDELAICAYWIGQVEEARRLNHSLLVNPALPADQRQRIEQNMWFCTNGRAA